MKPCRIAACTTPARSGQLMCREHWFQVPKPIRDAIWATWKARDMKSYVANVRAAEAVIEGKATA